MKKDVVKQPTPEQIAKAREAVGLLQVEAAEVCHLGATQRWSEYERGIYKMPVATWELFLLKTGQHPSMHLTKRRAA